MRVLSFRLTVFVLGLFTGLGLSEDSSKPLPLSTAPDGKPATASAPTVSSPPGNGTDLLLVPTPKSVQYIEGKTVTIASPLIITGGDLFPVSVNWLKERLQRTMKWEVTQGGAKGEAFPILMQRIEDEHGEESYRLELMTEGVTLKASNDRGMFRACARLLQILSYGKNSGENRDGFPALSITDWPDMPLRGMHLSMAWIVEGEIDERAVTHSIESMAMLGFNMVGFGFGGRFEFTKHPDAAYKPWWTKAQMAAFVKTAKDNGMTPIPCINALGHLECSPQICILTTHEGPRKIKMMDVTHPDFYPIYDACLDEIIETFQSPPYVHIGLDEIKQTKGLLAFSKMKKIPPEKIYFDFLKHTQVYLRQKGIKTVIWHDMLLKDGDFPGEEVNATDELPIHTLIDALDKKDLVINYWCYKLAPYRGFEALAEKGFSLWSSPWYVRAATQSLARKSAELKAPCFFGTTWGSSSLYGAAYIHASEYGWNANGEGTSYAPSKAWKINWAAQLPSPAIESYRPVPLKFGGELDADVKRAFAARKAPVGNAGVALQSGIFDMSHPRMFRAGAPAEIATTDDILSATNDVMILLSDEGNSLISGVNRTRGAAETILYTPERGETTGANEWGIELMAQGNEIVDKRDVRKADGAIPKNGFVISTCMSNRSVLPGGAFEIMRTFQKNDRIRIIRLPQTAKTEKADLDLRGARGIAILVSTLYPVATKLKNKLADIAVQTSDGKTQILTLEENPHHWPNIQNAGWKARPAFINHRPDGFVEDTDVWLYEWTGDASATRMKISVTPDGFRAGLVFHGIYTR